MARMRQYSRGTALRPIIREPQRSTDVQEARAVADVYRSGRLVLKPALHGANRLGNALAGRQTGGTQVRGGVYNGPVGQ